jgi:hypothetical protein
MGRVNRYTPEELKVLRECHREYADTFGYRFAAMKAVEELDNARSLNSVISKMRSFRKKSKPVNVNEIVNKIETKEPEIVFSEKRIAVVSYFTERELSQLVRNAALLSIQ